MSKCASSACIAAVCADCTLWRIYLMPEQTSRVMIDCVCRVCAVVIGHVDSGKSTTTGHLIYKLGGIDKRVIGECAWRWLTHGGLQQYDVFADLTQRFALTTPVLMPSTVSCHREV